MARARRPRRRRGRRSSSVVVEVGERRRRDEVERGDDVRIGRDGLDLGGDRARGRHHGDELAALLDEAVGHRDHGLARELRRRGRARWPPRHPRRWRARRGRRRRRRGWCRRSRPATRSPHCSRSSSTTLGARSRSRDPTTTSWPTLASRAAIPRPAGPVPPNTPIFIAESFAHPRPRSPPARPLPEHPAERVRMRHRSDGWWGRRSVVVPPRHRASHDRSTASHRSHAASTASSPRAPGTRRRLRRRQLDASASSPEARTRSPRRLPGRRRPAHLATVTPGRMSRRARAPYASFRSAAALWDLEGFAARRRRDHGAGIEPRRGSRASSCTRAPSSGRATSAIVDGIPVASAARTLCDLTAVAPAMDRSSARSTKALRRRIVDLADPHARRRRRSRVEGDCAAP